jgi:photosystem II stability/assembly factor-like uncharacterized protein
MMKNFVLALALAALAIPACADWVSIGPDGGNVTALALDPGQPATLYALPYEYPDNPRVFATSDGGAAWASVGRLPDYSVNALVVDQHQSSCLYGMTSSAVWRSTDAGVNWSSSPLPASAMGIATDPFAAGRVLLGGYSYTSYPEPAVMVSTDYGQTWGLSVLDTDTNYTYCIAFDPVNPGIAYAGCSYGVVFKTTDAGAHWTSASAGLGSGTSVQALAVNSANPQVVLAAGSDGVYRTTDAGGSWQRAGEMSAAFDVALTAANPALAYCVGYDTAPHLYVSTDTGATWTVQPGNMQPGKGGSLVTDPSAGDVVYAPGATGVLKTTDRGAHWTAANSGIRIATISTISVSQWRRRSVYLEAAANGVFESQCAGDTWTRCADFLSCGSICGIGLAPGTDADVLWALEGSG